MTLKTPTPATLHRGGVSRRAFSLSETAAININDRTVELAFSSTAPYERWWGIEVLSHSASAVRMGRLKNRAALLDNHDPEALIGVVEKAWLDGSIGRAVVRFSKNAAADAIFQDLVDGIRSKVSVGYMVHAYQRLSKTETSETYEITDWEPYEISIVSIPADDSVGVGRGADFWYPGPDQPPSAPTNHTKNRTKENSMTEPVTVTPAAAAPAQTVDHAATERARITEIIAIGEKFAQAALARKAIESGQSVAQFRAVVLDGIPPQPATPASEASIGMDSRELKRYSIVRAIHALANPKDASAQRAAAFEFECSEAAAKAGQRSSRGLLIPADVMRSPVGAMGASQRDLTQRDLVVGTASAGGNLVATDLASASMIDLLRARLVLSTLGITTLTDLTGNLAIPRQTAAATCYWVTEGNAPTESQQAVDQLALTPKTLGAFTDFSRKMILQSSLDVESFVRMDLAKVLALGIELAAINGSGSSGQPKGVLNQSGIGSVALGANGGAPTWDSIISLESALGSVNADVGNMGYLTNAVTRGKLKRTQKFSGTNGDPIWERDTTMNGYKTAVTNQVPGNLTKGSGTALSAIIFGNWSDVILGLWSGLDLMVDPYTNSTSGTVRVVALQDLDVAVRHVESFAAITDAITS